MTAFLSLKDAIGDLVPDGASVAMEGFTHLIPFAAGHEIIRQGKKGLTLLRMTPDLIYDQLIGMGCAQEVVFSWGGNPGVGSLYRLRDAIENEYPNRIDVVEHSHAAMANAYAAGAAGLPFAVFRGYVGVDLVNVNSTIKSIECPFTGERLACVPSHRPDVTIVHAQRANRRGDVLVEGIIGVQKEAVLAARKAIVTVEEIVDELGPIGPNACVLPRWTVDAIVEAPGGSWPSYTHGYSKRDNAFYLAWSEISKDRERFHQWIEQHVMKAAVA